MITKTLRHRTAGDTDRAAAVGWSASGGAGQTSSARWRSERPPIVFDGEIRHWLRIRLVFTRPYLGTARSMSKTLAVSTYSGGSSSSAWMLALPAFRSFFSLARAVRMSLARLSASIRWSSDLSGAAAEVLTGGGHVGGEYSRGSRRVQGRSAPFSAKFTSTSS